MLKTDRVLLRPISKKDLERVLIWANDPDVTRFLMMDLPMYEQEEIDWIESCQKRKPHDVVFAIEAEGKYIGNTGLHEVQPRDRTANIGIMIGEKDYWGQGYGREAICLLLEYAFLSLNLRKISLGVLAFNERAKKCYVKCGFFEEGVRKRQYYKEGKYHDLIWMAVFRKEWLKQHSIAQSQ